MLDKTSTFRHVRILEIPIYHQRYNGLFSTKAFTTRILVNHSHAFVIFKAVIHKFDVILRGQFFK